MTYEQKSKEFIEMTKYERQEWQMGVNDFARWLDSQKPESGEKQGHNLAANDGIFCAFPSHCINCKRKLNDLDDVCPQKPLEENPAETGVSSGLVISKKPKPLEKLSLLVDSDNVWNIIAEGFTLIETKTNELVERVTAIESRI